MILGLPFVAIIISIVKKWLEKRLTAKHLPLNTTDYYTDESYSSENEEHKSITRMIFDPLLKIISKSVNKALSENDIHDDDDDAPSESESETDIEQ